MQTIMAFPSIASKRPSKWFTRSRAISRTRFSVLPPALGDLPELLVQARLLRFVEFQPGEAALVVDRDGRAVPDGPLDVVDADVIPEHRAGVFVRQLDGGPGESDER